MYPSISSDNFSSKSIYYIMKSSKNFKILTVDFFFIKKPWITDCNVRIDKFLFIWPLQRCTEIFMKMTKLPEDCHKYYGLKANHYENTQWFDFWIVTLFDPVSSMTRYILKHVLKIGQQFFFETLSHCSSFGLLVFKTNCHDFGWS